DISGAVYAERRTLFFGWKPARDKTYSDGKGCAGDSQKESRQKKCLITAGKSKRKRRKHHKEKNSRENLSASKAIGKNTHRNSSERTQQYRNGNQKTGLGRRES